MANKIFTKNNILRALLFVVSVVIISYFLPRSDKFEYEYSQGKPWSYSLLTAPFDIPINLDSISIQQKKDSIGVNFVNIYRKDDVATAKNLKELWSKLQLIDGNSYSKNLLYGEIQKIYKEVIVDNATYEKINEGNLPEIDCLVENTS